MENKEKDNSIPNHDPKDDEYNKNNDNDEDSNLIVPGDSNSEMVDMEEIQEQDMSSHGQDEDALLQEDVVVSNVVLSNVDMDHHNRTMDHCDLMCNDNDEEEDEEVVVDSLLLEQKESSLRLLCVPTQQDDNDNKKNTMKDCEQNENLVHLLQNKDKSCTDETDDVVNEQELDKSQLLTRYEQEEQVQGQSMVVLVPDPSTTTTITNHNVGRCQDDIVNNKHSQDKEKDETCIVSLTDCNNAMDHGEEEGIVIVSNEADIAQDTWINNDDEVGQSKLLLTVAPELHTKVKGPYKEGWHEQGNVLEEENHNGGLDKALNRKEEEDDNDTNDTILLQGYQNNHVDQDAVKESKVKLDTTQECSLQPNQVDDSNKSKDSFLQDALTTTGTTIHMKNQKVDCCTFNHSFQSDHDDVRNRVRKWKDMSVVFVIALLIHPKTLEFFWDLTPLFDSPQEGKKIFLRCTLHSLRRNFVKDPI